MKTLSKIFIVLALTGLCFIVKPLQAPAQGVGVSFQLFYDDLSPYGQWVHYPGYNYVWIPDAGPDFSPYATAGHWVLTNFGWTWVSDYPWGWAPFHYGRWFFDDYYGWMWVPGREWGPAWVQWRRCDGFYGWAPISPGVSIDVAFGPTYHIRGDHWRFVRDRDFDRHDIDHYYLNYRENHRYIQNSTVITNRSTGDRHGVYYVAGPDRNDVQRFTGKAVREVAIRESAKPVQEVKGNELVMYKPIVQKTKGSSVEPIPQKAVPIKEATPLSQRTSQNPTLVQNNTGNNMGKVQPIHQNNNNTPNTHEHVVQPQPVTPINNNNNGKAQPIHPNNNTGKAQPVEHSGGSQPVHQKQEVHQKGATPVNMKHAEPVQKTENPPKK